MEQALVNWLLDSDPALRWQVERDLLDAPVELWGSTHARVSHEGFGAKLLALQDEDGQWAGGSYFPKGFDFATVKSEGQPWTATTWSLNSLREWGVDASALSDTADRLEKNSLWDYGDLPYWDGEVDCCINAYTLANGTWLGRDVSRLAQWFVEHQMEEGGWNCEWESGSVRSSFHSTLNSLIGILYYEQNSGGFPELTTARKAAEEFLLRRKLLFRLETGEQIAPWVTSFGYPTRWRYNVLRALEYFRQASTLDGLAPDPRLKEAIYIVNNALTPDLKLIQSHHELGSEWFPVDVPVGQPSKWLTLSALRTLRWWKDIK